MSRYSKTGRVAKCGSMDSKYFGKPEQFEKDIQEKEAYRQEVKESIKQIVLQDPSRMDQRFRLAIDVLKEIKEEFNL